MIFLDPLHPLQSAILELLGAQRGMTTSQLHIQLAEQSGLQISRQNLYRTVGLLLDNQLLVKKNEELHLNLVWLANLRKFLERASKLYLSPDTGPVVLPRKENETVTFTADSLRKLDPVWGDLLLELAKRCTDKHWFGYNARPWYPLGMRDTETRFYQGLLSQQIRIKMVHGNNTFLDQYGAGLLKLPGLTVKIAECPFLPGDGVTVWVIDNYVVECNYPPALIRQFNFFFNNVRKLEEFDIEQFSDIFRMRARCAVTVTKSRKRAAKLRTQLREIKGSLPARSNLAVPYIGGTN